MILSTLCLISIEIISVLGLIISIISLLILLKLLFNSKNNSQKNSDFEKTKLLIESQLQYFAQANDRITKTINDNNIQSINYLQKYFENQNLSIIGVEKRVKELLESAEQQLNRIDTNLKQSIASLQNDNAKKLDEMRQTVDEKLNVSLERRLHESFALISDRLDKVHRGLGEMQELATGVGDLKRVLTNVKTRGVWGEIGLGNILSEMLAPNQFDKEVITKPNTLERVDYVVILPGKDEENIYLPIDAKFPIEDYQRLIDASERADIQEIEKAKNSLYKRIKEEAKKIREKYISPPQTTDFAVLYLALEGLYAEIIKNSDLVQQLQRDYRIVICGPTTLTALINSLQMGFKTVAIEKRSSEIWNLLATFKSEFVKFVDLLAKTQKKLDEASGTIEDATKKTKKIQSKLNNISLPEGPQKIEISDDD